MNVVDDPIELIPSATFVKTPPLSERFEPPSIRDQLRNSTAELHARVDGHMGKLLQHTDGGYAEFLVASAEAILPLEHALEAANVSAILPDWEERSRSAALLADLADLSLSAPAWRNIDDSHRFIDEAYQFGVVYVLEGSRLGARVILRELLRSVKPLPMRYLSHGHDQPMWQTFIRSLEASPVTDQNRQRALSGAVAAFEMFLPAQAV